MSGRKLRWLGSGLVAGAGAGLLALTSMMNSAFAYGDVTPDVGPVTVPVEVMGGSGLPIPPQSYVDAVNGLYIQPNFVDITNPQALFTPEGLYPLTGVKSLELTPSVSQGVTILDNTIAPQLELGQSTGVFGYSQSAIISSLEMEQLAAADPNGPAQFVLIGDPMNPNGGLLERFAGLQLPSLGLNFYGATPSADFPTTVYTLEYDGFADFCQYPINLACDLNAFAGIQFVHGTYPSLTPAEVATGIPLTTTPGSLTDYYMIPVNNLPLLEPLRAIPVIGNPLADLIQPDLTTIVNLGYGDPAFGWSQGPADVPTQFGLFPPLADITKAIGLLLPDTQQGITNFVNDITSGSLSLSSLSLPSMLASASTASGMLSDPLAALSAAVADPANALAPINNIVNTLTSAAATAYATLLPTADIVNAMLTSIPLYDANLFVDSLLAGNLLDAVGLPIAADAALLTLAGGFEFDVISSAASTIISDLTSLIP